MTLGPQQLDQLIGDILRAHTASRALASAGTELAPAADYLLAIEGAGTLADATRTFLGAPHNELARPGLLVLLRHFGSLLPLEELESLRIEASSKPWWDPFMDTLISPSLGYARFLRSHFRSALESTETISCRVDRTNLECYVQLAVERVRGVAWQRLGDLQLAERHLTRSHELAEANGFAARTICTLDLATLKWASGKPREALALLRNPEFRAFTKSVQAHRAMALVHLNATKCALDLRSLDLALEELLAAEEILNAHVDDPRFDSYRGCAQLYAGELAAHQGNFSTGVDLIQSAQAWYEGMTPPRTTAALDAKISLAQVAFQADENRLAYDACTKLFHEAETSGLWDARSRLLLLESYVLDNDDGSRRNAFDSLVERAHLINNPVVMMKTLSNLLSYAVKYLSDEEQAFVHQRIRNQRQFLTRSCFDSLYQTYVTDRYAAALEKRLEEISGRSELWFDVDETDEDADDDFDDDHRSTGDG